MTVAEWIPVPADAGAAAQVFAALLFAVMFLRLCRYLLRIVGLGA